MVAFFSVGPLSFLCSGCKANFFLSGVTVEVHRTVARVHQLGHARERDGPKLCDGNFGLNACDIEASISMSNNSCGTRSATLKREGEDEASVMTTARLQASARMAFWAVFDGHLSSQSAWIFPIDVKMVGMNFCTAFSVTGFLHFSTFLAHVFSWGCTRRRPAVFKSLRQHDEPENSCTVASTTTFCTKSCCTQAYAGSCSASPPCLPHCCIAQHACHPLPADPPLRMVISVTTVMLFNM